MACLEREKVIAKAKDIKPAKQVDEIKTLTRELTLIRRK